MYQYEISDGPKMLREALCLAQNTLNRSQIDLDRRVYYLITIQHLIDECDRHRPLGSNGKHGNLHTDTCGCEDKGPRELWLKPI